MLQLFQNYISRPKLQLNGIMANDRAMDAQLERGVCYEYVQRNLPVYAENSDTIYNFQLVIEWRRMCTEADHPGCSWENIPNCRYFFRIRCEAVPEWHIENRQDDLPTLRSVWDASSVLFQQAFIVCLNEMMSSNDVDEADDMPIGLLTLETDNPLDYERQHIVMPRARVPYGGSIALMLEMEGAIHQMGDQNPGVKCKRLCFYKDMWQEDR